MTMTPASVRLGTTLGAKFDAMSAVATSDGTSGRTLPPSIGAEQLIQWLFVQMRHSNKDVQACLSEVESARDKMDALAKLQQQLREMKTKASTGADGSGDSKTSIDGSGIRWRDYKTPDGGIDEAKLAKEDWYDALSASGKEAVQKFIKECNTGDGLVMEKQLDKLMDAVKEDIGSLQSNNELMMINLQHVMQTRNQAIQLASNLIAIIDRAVETPINHIGKV